MSIGAFSISLTVADIAVSKDFYEKLGFSAVGGDMEKNWLIMRNDECTIGLFQGMFPKNTLTFNPGWNNKAEEINPFKDIRVIQEELRAKGIRLIESIDPSAAGPTHIFLEDPDGNPILIDQHRGI
jgi:catechol 2,3-dioxygenase-like lactoylglutathione lyase family enzyme